VVRRPSAIRARFPTTLGDKRRLDGDNENRSKASLCPLIRRNFRFGFGGIPCRGNPAPRLDSKYKESARLRPYIVVAFNHMDVHGASKRVVRYASRRYTRFYLACSIRTVALSKKTP